jgi:hypothetical protein
MRFGRWRSTVAALALGALLAAGTMPAAAAEQEGYWTGAGLGVGAVLANFLYMPAKLTYAALGTVTGALTYALTGGSYETAESVWEAALGGSYVVVPDMLTGQREIQFAGVPRTTQASILEEPASVARAPVAPSAPVASSEYLLDGRY